MNNCAIRLPSEDDKWLEFKNHPNKERFPFIIYADLECVLRRTKPAEKEDASYTYQQHEYHIQCDDVYETMKRDIARFDTSDYSPGNTYGMPLVNKKVPGLIKDENNGAIMTEFVGLRVKMYAVRVDGRKDIKKAKGVKNNVVTRTITFDDYTRYLNEDIEMTRRQSCTESPTLNFAGPAIFIALYTVSKSLLVIAGVTSACR
ncbi:uncharacterized protein LOC112552951 [Pogonomyrmex barbatus]|uniref:Uncharacterized protein LOC112552951 n=1 Tax=Pogonomyrmex barbatus TaxID=144034 RepID=A0A8N1SB03_9HYME|nr:uncharacterized protein LOC112552951 [Pogonomyrmex barbatus]